MWYVCLRQRERRGRLRRASMSRSEEHTSELQSQSNLVCRLLLEKKNNKTKYYVLLHQQDINCPSAHRDHHLYELFDKLYIDDLVPADAVHIVSIYHHCVLLRLCE